MTEREHPGFEGPVTGHLTNAEVRTNRSQNDEGSPKGKAGVHPTGMTANSPESRQLWHQARS